MGAAIHSWCVARAESKSGVRHGSKESRSLRDVCSKLHRSADDLTHAQGQREAATEYLAVASARRCTSVVNASAISPALVAFSSIGGLLSCAAHHMDIYRSRFPTYETRGGRGMGERQGPMDLAKLLETNPRQRRTTCSPSTRARAPDLPGRRRHDQLEGAGHGLQGRRRRRGRAWRRPRGRLLQPGEGAGASERRQGHGDPSWADPPPAAMR